MNWETLMCFGDSITIGARSYCGYPEYAGFYLEQKIGNKWNVINHAVSGMTSIELHRNISDNFHNLSSFNPSIVTLLIGTNDIKINTSPENFEIAVNQILIKAKLIALKSNVVIFKIPHFSKKIMYPYNFSMNDKINLFNEMLESFAVNHNVRIAQFDIKDEELFDGVHLNEAGSKSAGRQLAKFILTDRGIKE